MVLAAGRIGQGRFGIRRQCIVFLFETREQKGSGLEPKGSGMSISHSTGWAARSLGGEKGRRREEEGGRGKYSFGVNIHRPFPLRAALVLRCGRDWSNPLRSSFPHLLG